MNINAYDASGIGVMLAAPLREERRRRPGEAERWTRVAAHLASEFAVGRLTRDPAQSLAAERLDRLSAGLEARPTVGPADLAPGFELSATVLRHLQSDPLLPPALLPGDWPGPSLRSVYRSWDGDYRAVLRTWGRSARTT